MINSQAKGAMNRAQGLGFERLIDLSCDYYRKKGVANIEKTPEPMKPISSGGKNGRFTAVYTSRAQPDYKGTLNGGRSVVFEAKSTQERMIKRERVTAAQQEALEMHHRLGALCFVLVSMAGVCYAVPWEIWRDMKEQFGRKYVTADDVARYRAPFTAGGGVHLDFLNERLCEKSESQTEGRL